MEEGAALRDAMSPWGWVMEGVQRIMILFDQVRYLYKQPINTYEHLLITYKTTLTPMILFDQGR